MVQSRNFVARLFRLAFSFDGVMAKASEYIPGDIDDLFVECNWELMWVAIRELDELQTEPCGLILEPEWVRDHYSDAFAEFAKSHPNPDVDVEEVMEFVYYLETDIQVDIKKDLDYEEEKERLREVG